MDPSELQNVRLFPVVECQIVFAKSQISVYQRARWNVAGLLALFQFREEPKSVPASPSAGIRPDQHSDDARAAVRDRNCFLQKGDRFLRLIFWR
jgi:hypothetical protein